jgi:hypothetical protein
LEARLVDKGVRRAVVEHSADSGDFVSVYIAELRGRAANYERDGILDGARIYKRVAEELEARREAFESEELSIAEAAEVSGYDESAIRKMRKDGRIPDLKRKHIPGKPGHGADRPAFHISAPDGRLAIADEILQDMRAVGGRRR